MTKIYKLIKRFKSQPKDFTWDELIKLLKSFGFVELQGNGSRVKFFHHKLDRMIHLHKPHPGNILKPYMLKEVLNLLVIEKLL